MNTIQPTATLRTTQGKSPLGARPQLPAPSAKQVEAAEKTRDAFTQFVGATVFGQMMGSMRKTVGEPAYFHGGRGEEVFQGQLDQTLADEMIESGQSPFADGMFKQQFPAEADILRRANEEKQSLNELNALRRR